MAEVSPILCEYQGLSYCQRVFGVGLLLVLNRPLEDVR